MDPLDLLKALASDWHIRLETHPGTVWRLTLTSRAGRGHIYTGALLPHVIRRAHAGEPPDGTFEPRGEW